MKDFGAVATLKRFFDTPALAGERDYLLAELATKAGRFQESAEAYMQVAARHPKFREKALYEAMISYEETRDVAKALSVAETLLKEFPGGASAMDALYQRARVYEMAGELGKAARNTSSSPTPTGRRGAAAGRSIAPLVSTSSWDARKTPRNPLRNIDALSGQPPPPPLLLADTMLLLRRRRTLGGARDLASGGTASRFGVRRGGALQPRGELPDAKLRNAPKRLSTHKRAPEGVADAKAGLMEKMTIKLRSGDAEAPRSSSPN
jgi:tetratricopeptide (TPR) repeat protein